jgi:hypothetical protein
VDTNSTPGDPQTTIEAEDTPGTPADRAGAASGRTTVADVARTVAAVAMLGAAVIHFAFAPDHLSEQTSHGVFFIVVAWAQLLGAAALAFSWRPLRTWLLGTAGLNLGVAALWLLTRTAGLPGEEAESVAFPDALASGLEVTAALAALAVALDWLVEREVRRPALAVTGVPVVAMVAVVTASVVPSLGGGHAHGEGDDHGGDGADGSAEMAAGHGHGESAAAGGDDEWNARRISALTGYLPDEEAARFREVNMEFLSEQIRARSETLGELPEAEREAVIAEFVEWSVDNALEAESGAATGDEPTMHSHGVTEWQDIDDPADQRQLQAELQTAGQVIAAMPTAADAVAANYFQVTPYVPGIGAHYLNPRLLTADGFDPAKPEMLLYNGNEPTSELVGLSYAVLGDEAPAGFVGPNDEWHVHPSLCIVGTLVVGPDSTPDEMCESIGGHKGMPFEKPMWMGHLWQVPGWESPWGLFSGENPVVNLATSDLAT